MMARTDSPRVRQVATGVLAALAVALPLLPVPAIWLEQANYIGLFSLAVMGLVLLTGVAGFLSFAQAPFMGIAAYCSAWLCLNYGLSPWVTLPVSLAVTGLAAWGLAYVTLKMSGHYLPLATIAWGMALYYLFGSSEALGKHEGLTGLQPLSVFGRLLSDSRSYYWLILVAVAGTAWCFRNLLNSHPGRAIRALKGGAAMPEAMGVNTWRTKVQVFILSALTAAMTGWLYAHLLRGISPEPFGLLQSVDFVIMLVLGGMAHLGGAVLGATLVVVFKEQLKTLLPSIFGVSGHLEVVIFGLALLLCLRFAPDGLWPAIAGRLQGTKRPPLRDVTPLPRRTPPPKGQTLLEVKGLRKTFGGLTAVSGISLQVTAGEIVGLIGPNGAGKSTTFNLITGELAPTSGTVVVQGQSTKGRTASEIALLAMSRTFQHVRLLPDMTVLENVALGAHARANVGMIRAMLRLDRATEAQLLQEAASALKRVGLDEFMHHQAGSLALGQQRLVEIARALCSDPALLLLDEPAAGLRAFEKRALATLLAELRAQGMAILLVEHDMEFVMQLADRLVVMVFGTKIAEGKPEMVQRDPGVQAAYLGETA